MLDSVVVSQLVIRGPNFYFSAMNTIHAENGCETDEFNQRDNWHPQPEAHLTAEFIQRLWDGVGRGFAVAIVIQAIEEDIHNDAVLRVPRVAFILGDEFRRPSAWVFLGSGRWT